MYTDMIETMGLQRKNLCLRLNVKTDTPSYLTLYGFSPYPGKTIVNEK